MKQLIRCEGIVKSYGDLKVLKGVDFSVNKGEIISIVGVSGAGKTTLLKIIGTIEKPDNGKVWMNEKDVFNQNEKELARFRNKSIGFVFQFHQLLPEFSALENVCIPAMIGGESRKLAGERAKKILSELGLGLRLDHKPSELSGGEQQRVSVARALINNPELILADEPTGNLDSANAEDLHQLFFSLREKYGHTFIIVTHNENLANLADRKLTMKDGKMLV